MAQVVTRIDDKLVADLDGLVADGFVASRSEAVRMALEQLVDQHRKQRVAAEIVAGYERCPETEEELAGFDRKTRALVAEEPW
ncbi:MAG TPA: ribbon-helix-helix protein, CopG family [Solirubrobacteraceae bacterium]|jgi:Arc/MetJ-type ribon-helix-helix transcriptional regulator|nr:ribbon-helix-helix protein, CopG family [Solirubrobacteraceae bacterium]